MAKSKKSKKPKKSKQIPSLVGKTFGRLTVQELALGTKTLWACKCSCGAYGILATTKYLLKGGDTVSCGCRCYEICSAYYQEGSLADKFPDEFQAWQDMWRRCADPCSDNFLHHGGKGIIVCVAWQSFETFMADVGPCPSQSRGGQSPRLITPGQSRNQVH